MPAELAGPLVAEALRIIREAQDQGIVLKLLGSTAVRVHCQGSGWLFDALNRLPADIDLISCRSLAGRMPQFMKACGYESDEVVLALHGDQRQIYSSPATKFSLDIFFDRINFCHDIDLRKRLDGQGPTIDLADIILEKLQILKITENDLKDLFIALAEHPVGKPSPETIDAGRIARVLAVDWGFYHTAMTNLRTFSGYAKCCDVTSSATLERVLCRTASVVDSVNAEPKSLQWRARARVGTRVKWYNDVEDIRR